jgi:hypothetical protein
VHREIKENLETTNLSSAELNALGREITPRVSSAMTAPLRRVSMCSNFDFKFAPDSIHFGRAVTTFQGRSRNLAPQLRTVSNYGVCSRHVSMAARDGYAYRTIHSLGWHITSYVTFCGRLVPSKIFTGASA